VIREIIDVCSQIHTKHTDTLCVQNVEFFNVNPGGSYSNHWLLTYSCLFYNPISVSVYTAAILGLLVDSELNNILKGAWITSRLERFGKEINLQPTSTKQMPG